jgi:UDP:flavonoid glycosyltransferase YjiC (YdhE family)
MGHRIVIATTGSYGDVNPYIGLSVALIQRGHEPVIATSAFYREAIEREGIGFHPVGPEFDPKDPELLRRVMDPKRGTEFILRDLVFPHLREAYEGLSQAATGADALITHPITFAGPIVAQQQRKTWISTVLAPISFFSAYELPVIAPFPWMQSAQKLGLWASRALVKLAKRVTVPWTKPWHSLRQELGMPPAPNPVFEGQHSPQLVLALFSRVLSTPQPDWPEQVQITGPIFYDGHPLRQEVWQELQQFLDEGPAPVVFTLGSSAVNTAGTFFEESLQAVRQLGCRALMLVGSQGNVHSRASVPRTIKLMESAPHSLVFSRAAAIVHQGGIGTAQQALRAGCPELIVPFAHDQPDNADRIRRLGVAQVIYPARYRAHRVAQVLGRLLDDEACVRRAADIGQEIRQEQGARQACEQIEILLGDAPNPRDQRDLSRP